MGIGQAMPCPVRIFNPIGQRRGHVTHSYRIKAPIQTRDQKPVEESHVGTRLL